MKINVIHLIFCTKKFESGLFRVCIFDVYKYYRPIKKHFIYKKM